MDAENNKTAKYVLWCEVQMIVVLLVILVLKYSAYPKLAVEAIPLKRAYVAVSYNKWLTQPVMIV